MIKYTAPKIVDYGSIVKHTFYRCDGGNPGASMPKDWNVFPHDKFGECSAGHTGLS